MSELNCAVFARPVAAFRLIPYRARKAIVVPVEALDVTPEQLREMEKLTVIPEEDDAELPPDDEDDLDGAYDNDAE